MPSHEPQETSFEKLVFHMLGDLKEAAAKMDTNFEGRIRRIEDARLSEAGFKKGATWLAKLIWACCAAVGVLVLQAVMKHFGLL